MIACRALLPLQDFDLQIDELKAQIDEKKQKAASMAADVSAEVKLNDKKLALLKKIKLRRQTAESELAVLSGKISDTELKMRSAGVVPRAYRALEKELDSLKSKADEIETKVIEDLEKIEILQKDTDKGSKFTAGRKEHLSIVQKRVSDEIAELNKEIDNVRTQRNQSALSVESAVLNEYEELRRKKGGKVIFGVDSNGCPKCGMGFSSGFLTALKSHEEGEICSHCGAIIYWTGSRDI